MTHIDLTGVPPAMSQDTWLRRSAQQVARLWWIPLVAGAISIGIGIGILVTDWTIRALVIVTGVLLLLRGLALALHPEYAAEGAGEQVVAGVVSCGFGLVLIFWPRPTLLVLAAMFGIWLALSGVFHVVSSAARRRHLRRWGFGVAIGAIELLLGIWVMRRPEATLSLAITVIGLWTVITGVIHCVQAFELRGEAKAVLALTAEAESVAITDARAPHG